jgi:hypothetical protein
MYSLVCLHLQPWSNGKLVELDQEVFESRSDAVTLEDVTILGTHSVETNQVKRKLQ